MTFIDSHAHIDAPEFDADRDQVVDRAHAAGVTGIVVVGAGENVAIARRAVALAESRSQLWATVGIHPHNVAAMRDEWLDELRALAQRSSVVAVGETGLDYHYDTSPRDVQRARFSEFIELAAAVGKPVVCHIRDAHDDARRLLAAARTPAIIHCFTGTPDDAASYVEMGFSVSFSGIITFRNAEPIRAAVCRVPADRILIETDCPFLAPAPNRGRRNEPAFLVHTAAVVAHEAGLTTAELGTQTSANTRQVLSLT
jgi:TatD DNase family protein